MGAILAIGGFMIIFILVILIGVYVLTALAIGRVLAIYGYENTWMAWIPFINYFALADAVCEGRQTLSLFGKELPAILFKFWWIGQYILSQIPYIGWICSIAVAVLFFGTVLTECYARIEDRPVEDMQVLGFISGWITIIPIIKFLTYDKNKRLS